MGLYVSSECLVEWLLTSYEGMADIVVVDVLAIYR